MTMKRIVELLESIDQKLGTLVREQELKDIHRRILNLLESWMTTADISKAIGYRQEYISRKVASLKKANLVEEKRIGRKIYYKRRE
jgi:DNA-binding transcriptional ArsR family regulator